MRGYPKVIATKADFMNLLAEPEFKDRALVDLKAVYDLQDDTADKVVSYDMDDNGQMINVVTSTVEAVMPTWKRMGFTSRAEVMELYKG
jgi:hypothetical protein